KITDETTGEPVPGVGIFAVPDRTETGRQSNKAVIGGLMNTAKTNEEGVYKLILDIDEERDVRLLWRHVHSAGYGPLTEESELTTVRVGPGDKKTLDFALSATPFNVRMKFVDENGEPIQGIRAGIHLQDRGWGIQGSGMTSDEEGWALWEGLTAGETYIALGFDEKFRELGRSARFTGGPGETVPEVLVYCLPRGDIEGTIVDASGNPVPEVKFSCWLVDDEGNKSPTARGTTSEDGSFLLRSAFYMGAYPKGYLVFAVGEKGDKLNLSETGSVEIAGGSITDLGTLSGKPTSMEEVKSLLQ
ncbi:hypothetical protein ACFL1X_13705, partial [Candidatus Hydrogenedentota bacterium]